MDVNSIIKQPILKEFDVFRDRFHSILKSDDDLLNRVLFHLSKRTGKMMRPTLTLLLAKSLGEINDFTYSSALSLELLHTASLVHDDVVDESKERRGLPSVHSLFDNKVAVLVGDYLLATSLKCASESTLEIVNVISRLGMHLSEGELLQLSNISSHSFSEEVYFRVIQNKTADLFAACGQVAALSQHADQAVLEKYKKFGLLLGMVFQIKDDIFDYLENAEIGKPTANDMREGKLTLPALYALNTSGDDEMRKLALRIRSLNATDEEIHNFMKWVIEQGGIAYAERKMEEICKDALSLIQDIQDLEIFHALSAFLLYCKDRKK